MLLKAGSHKLLQTVKGSHSTKRSWTPLRGSLWASSTHPWNHFTWKWVSEALVDNLPTLNGATGNSSSVPSALSVVHLPSYCSPCPTCSSPPQPHHLFLWFVPHSWSAASSSLWGGFPSPPGWVLWASFVLLQGKLQGGNYHIRLTWKTS